MELPKVINNLSERVIDDLRSKLSRGATVSIAAASFSIYAFEALKEELEQVDELRFIFTSPTFIKEKVKKEKREFFIPKLHRERNLYGSDFEVRLRNKLEQKAIAKECAEWIRRKVQFRSNASQEAMGGFLHVQSDTPCAYVPFNEFTTTELGCERGNSVYSMVNVMPSPFAEEYLKIFNEQWHNSDKFQEVTAQVLQYIETVYQENAPEFIYFLTIYHLFSEFLDDLSEDVLPNEATGFKQSVIWNKLYHFQKDAALAIIHKLEKYNGCILADSVGLGKTFTALGVIKYYENRNKSVLVLCPKKLYENWSTFKSNYKNNPLVADRLRYDILFHSDLNRERGMSAGIDLERIHWGNYDLIVIDESHNFRNGGNVDEEEEDFQTKNEKLKDRENRYQRLMKRVIRAGVKSKVLMLSATPVNNRFNDLKNQLQLAYEGHAAQMNEALELDRSIDDIFRNAQSAYNKWSRLDAAQRTTERLLESLNFDFFQLLDAVTIARSRRHIVKYYDTKDIGQFPTRLTPISRRPKLTDLSESITFSDIAGQLNELNLSIYTPSLYIFDSVKDDYEMKMEGSGLSIDGREKGLRKLMATNLLKRLESSVNSFRLTLERIIQRFGRIDRIGSRNKVIQLVNYWPDMELDHYIELKGRVESRMKATVLTSTGDDNLLSTNEKGDLEYRKNQLRKLQEEVVDMEDMDTGISIMDLGLNEFRLDLLSYIKEHPDVEHAPFGMHAVAGATELAKPGVIFILKNRNAGINIDKKNLLHPFYMIYLSEQGTVLCDHLQPKRLLDVMRHLCKGHSRLEQALCTAFNRETADGRKMQHYSELLAKAVESIITIKEESDIDSLFTVGETTALYGDVKGLDDFELITFLIIR